MNHCETEQHILRCNSITDDLEIIRNRFNEGILTPEELDQVLSSLIVLYNVRFNYLLDNLK